MLNTQYSVQNITGITTIKPNPNGMMAIKIRTKIEKQRTIKGKILTTMATTLCFKASITLIFLITTKATPNNTANDQQTVTIPVKKSPNEKCFTSDVELALLPE